MQQAFSFQSPPSSDGMLSPATSHSGVFRPREACQEVNLGCLETVRSFLVAEQTVPHEWGGVWLAACDEGTALKCVLHRCAPTRQALRTLGWQRLYSYPRPNNLNISTQCNTKNSKKLLNTTIIGIVKTNNGCLLGFKNLNVSNWQVNHRYFYAELVSDRLTVSFFAMFDGSEENPAFVFVNFVKDPPLTTR
jgi:hypothetical protein